MSGALGVDLHLERLTMRPRWAQQFIKNNEAIRAVLKRKGDAIAAGATGMAGDDRMEVDVFDDDRQGRDRIGVVGHHPTPSGRRALPAALLGGMDSARAAT